MDRVLNGLMWILAIGIGLYPVMVWFMPDDAGLRSSKPPALLRDPVWRIAFYTHITYGGLALLAGVSQFNRQIRARWAPALSS